MKTIYTTILGTLIWLSAIAAKGQLVINTVEKLPMGTTYSFWLADTAGAKPGSGGQDVVWDFSNLNISFLGKDAEVLLPSQTAYESVFAGSNEVRKTSDGSYIFLNRKADSLFTVGFRSDMANLNIHYTKPLLFAVNKMAYGDEYTTTAEYEYQFNGTDFIGSGQYNLNADGYGKLTVNGRTFENVLRIKLSQNFEDKIKANGIVVSATKIAAYRWYNAFNSSAILSMDSVVITTQGGTENRSEILVHKNPSGTLSVKGIENIALSAVIKQNFIELTGIANSHAQSVDVYDITGKLITHETISNNNNIFKCPLPYTPITGQLFLVKINTATGTKTIKLGLK